MTILTSARLRFEPFDDSHLDGLHAMNGDPAVMRYITGKPETRAETEATIARVKARWATLGHAWWSLFERDSGLLVGAGGVQHLGHDPANPLELGWRLRQDQWGKGLALEAAQAMAAFAFDTLDGEQVCAICDPRNLNSARVMERLGMRYRAEETWHGRLVSVYVLSRATWRAAQRPA